MNVGELKKTLEDVPDSWIVNVRTERGQSELSILDIGVEDEELLFML